MSRHDVTKIQAPDDLALEREFESRLGPAVRAVPPPQTLSAEAHARILRNLQLPATANWRPSGRLPARLVAVVVAVFALVLGVGAAAGILLSKRLDRPGCQCAEPTDNGVGFRTPEATAGPHVETSSDSHSEAPRPEPNREAIPSTAESRRESQGTHGMANRRPQSRPQTPGPGAEVSAPPSVAPAAVPGTSPSSVGSGRSGHREDADSEAELELLHRALEYLNRGQYQDAIDTLAGYEQQYPRGRARGDVVWVRLNALVRSSRTKEALALVDSAEVSGRRAADILAKRGELRLEIRRYEDALKDFEHVLNAYNRPDLEERLRYFLVYCHAQLGEGDAKNRRAHEYLAKFPRGEHAAEVQTLLKQ
jgi:outer membrane protein assembly factor BamD (BamD/ComL family)